MSTVPAATRSRHLPHALRVAALERLTEDADAVTFAVPPALAEAFRFAPGQHVALLRPDGDGVRRSYSICSAAGGPLRVAVKHLPGGALSTYVHRQLAVGDSLEVFPPVGTFTTAFDPTRVRRYAAIAAGSGITPVLSLVSSALALEPGSDCTLIYGNRTTRSIMFLEDLAALKDRYAARLQLIHVLSRERQGVELLCGRIDPARLERITATLLPPAASIDEWFLCGPPALMDAAITTLTALGVARRAIRRERFHAHAVESLRAPQPRSEGAGADVEVTLYGRHSRLRVSPDGESILSALLRVRPDAPYACTDGVCGTCRCVLRAGRVRMDHPYALEPDEIDAGVVLACQSHPASDRVALDFDAR